MQDISERTSGLSVKWGSVQNRKEELSLDSSWDNVSLWWLPLQRNVRWGISFGDIPDSCYKLGFPISQPKSDDKQWTRLSFLLNSRHDSLSDIFIHMTLCGTHLPTEMITVPRKRSTVLVLHLYIFLLECRWSLCIRFPHDIESPKVSWEMMFSWVTDKLGYNEQATPAGHHFSFLQIKVYHCLFFFIVG